MSKVTEKMKWTGKYKLIVYNKKLKKVVRERVFFNTITDLARNEIIKPLYGDTPDIEIGYLAIGTGTTSSSSSDTKLETEVFRTADYSLSAIGNGIVQSDFSILDVDYSGVVNEIGIFGGSSASDTADSGTLISRINYSDTKLADEEWYFQRLDIIGG